MARLRPGVRPPQSDKPARRNRWRSAQGRKLAAVAATIPRVPTISVFYGIVIAMFFDDHPPPHFHARYAEHEARISIETGEALGGKLPARASRLVREWTDLHRGELEDNWRLREQG